MALADKFNRVMQETIRAQIAWLPVANTFKVGDFGLISHGVFVRMGHIRDFGVEHTEAAGEPVQLDFTSANTTVTRFAAGAAVDVLPAQSIDARVDVFFEDADAFSVKAARIDVLEMQNVLEVARTLRVLPTWERHFRIVQKTCTAKNAVLLATKKAGTKVSLSAKADALKQLELGKASAEIGIQSSSELALKFVGKSGVIALGLFKLGWFGGVDFLRGGEALDPAKEIEQHEDWSRPPTDDV